MNPIKQAFTKVKEKWMYLYGLTILMLNSASPANAADGDIFDKAAGIMNDIYGAIAGISSVTAGCVATVCLFLMFFSKNQRTVDESIQWLKRIFIIWLAIILMSSILKFFSQRLLDGATPTSLT